MSAAPVRLVGIERSFGSVVALDGADLEVRAGEVHGVLGANGAGKSTLLNVLGGMIQPDGGRIEVDGEAVAVASPRDAWAKGIALVHQHFTLVPRLSVLENLALGRGRSTGLEADVEALMLRTSLAVPLDRPVEELGVGDRQRVEILKALLRDPRVLVLDEPTAVLTPGEIDGLFDLLREIAGDGRAVVLVAHKLDEVLSVAHRITVLRDGRTVLSGPAADRSVDELVRAMVGSEKVDAMAIGLRDRGSSGADGVSRADEVSRAGEVVAKLASVGLIAGGVHRLDRIGLEVRRGEVVGVAGVEGNGQRELALLLSGRVDPTSGSATLPDEVGFIPQDRSSEGLIGSFDLTENVALALHRDSEYVAGSTLRWDALREAAEGIRTRFDVAAPSVDTRAAALSGGNQQRVIVGRELHIARDLLVAENPTRGLDVAAAAFVHEEIVALARSGVAVVLISTDLDEVMGLADRVLVLASGRLYEAEGAARSREGIGALMLGGADG